MLDFVIFAICSLSTVLMAIFLLYQNSQKVATIPGMRPSCKEDGNLSDIGRAGSLHEFLMELHEQYGKIAGFWWGKTYTVSIASPELFKQHSKVFDRPFFMFKMYVPLIGLASIQYANGTDGRTRRQYHDRAYGNDRLRTYYEHIQKSVDLLMKDWSTKTEEDHVPLYESMFKVSLRAALLTIFGQNFQNDQLVLDFRHAYDKVWKEMERRLADPIIPDENSPRMKEFEEALNFMKKTVQDVVEYRKATALQGTLLIDEIIEAAPNSDVIKSDSITYLVGSSHTTCSLMTWCLYFLASHEEVQEKLYKEIMDVLGDNELVDETNLGQLTYLRQVLDETLRCGLISPWGARCQDVDSELGGYKIPKNTPVVHAFGVAHHDKELWLLPKKFDPERFNAENSKSRHTYAFQPFGFAGKRKCPGYKFAYQESSVLLATALRKFKLRLQGEQVAVPFYGLVTHTSKEIWLKLIKRI